MADDLVAELGIAAERLAVLPNPVDFDGLRNLAEPAPWPGFVPRLLAVGRLSREKGFDLLLRAVTLIRRDYPHAGLVIVGKGPEEARLKALATELGVADAVCFAGYVERPWQFYAGADIFVLSSRHEGMPNALIEAIAGGLPIVATPASGGLVDLLKGCTNAWLAPDASVAGLTQVLALAIESLEAQISSWDRHRSEKLARIRTLVGSGRLLAERMPAEGMAVGPREPRYAEFSGEFAFERAFEAYEALIDGLCAEYRA
jgi:glycosyltransferase involved in cell wall biosynthesis